MQTGGCHCGKVRYEVKGDLSQAITCNCSMCMRKGTILAFVPLEQFKQTAGEQMLTDYQFHKKSIHHLFCKVCGVTSFAKGKSPDGKEMAAINIRCLDNIDLSKHKITEVDGKSW
jgi:hypothetical protein